MNKLIINCTTGIKEEIPFSPEEIVYYLAEQQKNAEQVLLDSLKPSQEEIDQAKFEVNSINLLTEVGLL